MSQHNLTTQVRIVVSHCHGGKTTGQIRESRLPEIPTDTDVNGEIPGRRERRGRWYHTFTTNRDYCRLKRYCGLTQYWRCNAGHTRDTLPISTGARALDLSQRQMTPRSVVPVKSRSLKLRFASEVELHRGVRYEKIS